MRRFFLRSSLSLAFAFSALPLLRAETSALFDLGGEDFTTLVGVSANGRVLFGSTIVPEALPTSITRPLVWHFENESWARTVLPADPTVSTRPVAASADGTVIVGAATLGFPLTPIVWTFEDSAWQSATLPLPAAHGAEPEFISADGTVVVGAATPENDLQSTIAWVWRRESSNWTGGALPNGENGAYRNALSSDGSTVGGGSTLPAEDDVMVVPSIWRYNGAAWQPYTLRAPDGTLRNGQVHGLSADGRTAVGALRVGAGEPDWRAVAWTYSGATDVWTAVALPGLGNAESHAYSISADGTRVVGEARRKPLGAPVAARWTRVGDGWSASPLGTIGSGFSRGTAISADGRLALRDQSSGRTLFHLPSARNLPLPALVFTLEGRPSADAGWNFSGDYANIEAVAGPTGTDGYTLIGHARKENDPHRPWVVSGYAPFLFGETTRVGDAVSATLPDLGTGAYKVTGLPAGLSYDDSTRLVSGRFSRIGLYTTTILNLANNRKRTVVTLVEPLPSTSIGAFQALLSASEGEAHPVARVTVEANITGAFTGTLESDDDAIYKLKGVFAVDPATPGELAAFPNRDASEAGLLITRKKGSDTAAFRLRLNLRPDGSLLATLEAVGAGPYASSLDDGTLQTRYAGKTQENSAPWKGRYTAALGVASSLVPDGRPLPAGSGFALLTVSANGKLSASGRLADGQAFSGSVLPGADGAYRLFFRPYRLRRSLLAGWLRFEPRGGGLYHVASENGGDLYWSRAAMPNSLLYPAGFGVAGLALRVEPWLTPASAASFGTSEEIALPLNLASADFSNATPDNRYELPQDARFLPLLRLAPEADRAGNMQFSVNRDTGKVTGAFTLTEAEDGAKRRVTFQGVLLQPAPDDATAPILQGYFLQKALKNADSPATLSGLISLTRPSE